jgi:quercetin dioxygenase-like cupin family protein
MEVRNFLKAELEALDNCHKGVGTLRHTSLFKGSDFNTNIRFMNYTILPPGTSIGEHKHGDNEELYIILEGQGIMTVDGETRAVSAGDVIVNKPFGTHGLSNNSDEDLKILVMEVYNLESIEAVLKK